jgi:hypothetical protein
MLPWVEEVVTVLAVGETGRPSRRQGFFVGRRVRKLVSVSLGSLSEGWAPALGAPAAVGLRPSPGPIRLRPGAVPQGAPFLGRWLSG